MHSDSSSLPPVSPEAGKRLIPLGDRPSFILWYVGLTVLAGILCISPVSWTSDVLFTAMPAPILDSNNPQEWLDIFSGIPVQIPLWQNLLNRVMTSLVEGIFIATAQWFVLRKYFSKGSWWAVATALGYGVSGMLSVLFPRIGIYGNLLPSIGRTTVQAIALRWQVRQFWLWILVAPVAALFHILVFWLVDALSVQLYSLIAQVGHWVHFRFAIYLTVVAGVEAIAFCLFYRKSGRSLSAEE